MGLAGCLLFVIAPLGWLLIRSTPESVGISVESTTALDQQVDVSPVDTDVMGALVSPVFWVLTLGAALFNLSWSAIMLFQEKLLEDRGFDHGSFLLVMTLMVVTGIPANMLTGWLAKPRRIGLLLTIGLMVLAGALIAFPWLSSKTDVLLYGVALGVSGGMITVIFFTAYGQAFGRAHLGKIQSIVQVITTFASAIGPVLLTPAMSAGVSWIFFYCSAVLAIVLAYTAYRLRLPTASTGSAV
jgi:MFS family permease